MNVDQLIVKFEADTEDIQVLLNELEILRDRFPAAVRWLFDKPGRFEGMLEVKPVEVLLLITLAIEMLMWRVFG